MELHIVPLAPMQAVKRKLWEGRIEVYAVTDQGPVRLFLRDEERGELDRLLTNNEWPAQMKVATDQGQALLHLTRHGALSVHGLATMLTQQMQPSNVVPIGGTG